jgi:hypothetical protein
VKTVVATLIERNRLEVTRLEALAGQPYLFVEDESEIAYGAWVRGLPGQYVRRVVATALGCDDEWDYGAFPRFTEVQETIAMMRGRADGW